MDVDHQNVRSVINEDRLSSLPDELIHQILSCIDSKFAVQTCLLSSRWKLLWTSMPSLNFSYWNFPSLPKFSKFVNHFLSHRNHQTEVASVSLNFHGAASQVFVRKIANYAFSHNVQELTVVCRIPKRHHKFPLCLFSSQSLKRFTFNCDYLAPCLTPTTPWDFPSLTSLHLRSVRLCDENSKKSPDLFSKCVNLKNLTLESFFVDAVEGLDIVTPQLSNLTLIDSKRVQVINLIAPRLENLTVINCSISYLNAPAGVSSLCYRGFRHAQLSKEGFHSLNKVTICLSSYCSKTPYKEEDARRTINMLQEVHSARFLTLNADIVECISSFPELLSHLPSPFSNLICLNIDSGMRKDACKVNMPAKARDFLLKNSPSATFIMDLPEAPAATEAMQRKEAREKRMAALAADFEIYIAELQASLELRKTQIEKNKQYKSGFQNLLEGLCALTKQRPTEIDSERTPIDQRKMAQIDDSVEVIRGFIKQETKDVAYNFPKEEALMKYLLKPFTKRKRAEIEARYSHVFEEFAAQYDLLVSEIVSSKNIIDAYEKMMSDNMISTFQHVSSCEIPLASSQPSTSSSATSADFHLLLNCNTQKVISEKMDFDHCGVKPMMEKDRLSSLPDELIHQILSCIDSKFAIQTCLLSSRWKLLWTSMPCLNFSSRNFGSLPKFTEFVTHVLTHRNHQIDLTSVKLSFHGEANQVFVRKIAKYAFSHNVQELTVVSSPKSHHEFPPCLFSSRSLKSFTLSCNFHELCLAPKTPWDFPALTSLRLDAVKFCDEKTGKSANMFSKCVNLKNLTLESFILEAVDGFDIITPRLSNLTLIKGRCLEGINLIAPELENLTVTDCSIKYLNAPPGLSSLCYRGYHPLQLSKGCLRSLNEVTIWLSIYCSNMPYKEEDARKTINMLQEVRSARLLTLNADIVECISSFPGLLSHHPSPFSNLICLNIDSSMRKDAYKVKISTQAKKFLLENSPSAKFIMELPQAPPTKAMQQKEARAKKKAKLAAEIENHMMELQTSLDQGKLHAETKELFKSRFEDLMVRLQMLMTHQRSMQIASERPSIEQVKEYADILKAETQMEVFQRQIIGNGIRAQLVEQIETCAGVLRGLLKLEYEAAEFIFSRKFMVRLLLDNLPKRQRTEIEACYSRLLKESDAHSERLISERDTSCHIIEAYEKFLSYMASS
ncbi:hypothetical protein OSB04_022404 [Centaurea solstitialis]|uniref:F-box domain-containing protein n=1 Tax=Centaurea solstitialis TaxID=347529 RepID=A0AA38WIP2_9ASTR|nr:hypothetical protein OSB04_022404 [Centaurea solstitialis]